MGGWGCCWAWYGFYGSVLASEAAFEGKVDELCRELGSRGQAVPS